MKKSIRSPQVNPYARISHRLGATLCCLGLATLACFGKEPVPLKADLTGALNPLPPAPTANCLGVGTICGLFTQNLTFTSLDFENGWGAGTYVQTAANGDSFYGAFTLLLYPTGEFTGTFTVDDGDGRFAGVTGDGTSAGVLHPDLTFDYHYDGQITFPDPSEQ